MKTLALTLALLAPVQALALSCVPPSVERSYGEAAASPEQFVVVKGRITFDESKLPKADLNMQKAPKLTTIAARLKGHQLGATGFKTAFDAPLAYDVRCLGVWCGSGNSGQDIIAFMQLTDVGYVLEIGPCGGRSFAATRANVDAVKACHTSGNCTQ